MVVLEELICNIIYVGKMWCSSQNCFLTLSLLGGCGGLERTAFVTVSTLGMSGGLERVEF